MSDAQKADMRTATAAKRPASKVIDSSTVAAEVSQGGALRFYLRTLLSDPQKIIIGVADSLVEIARFILRPRFAVGFSSMERLNLVRRWIVAELKVPGGTTVLETIWLTYGAALATNGGTAWVEVGCFKGLSTARLSLLCAAWNRHLFVFDTFEGLPGSDAVYEAVDRGVSYHFKAGSYAGTEQEVRRHVGAHGRIERITLVKGDVAHTLPKSDFGEISFAFFDVDLVESYRACFAGVAMHIGPGTVVAIHEACYLPIRQLIEDPEYWKNLSIRPPEITYVAEKYRIRSIRNLALLKW